MRTLQSLVPAAAALLVLAAGGTSVAAAATVPVTTRTAFTDTEIKAPVSAGLPDGRAAIAWTNDLTTGDSTLGMVRSAGRVLPASAQVLSTGAAAEDLSLLPGGPTASPLLTTFQGGVTQTAMSMRLDRESFGAQHALLGLDAKGRYPSVARCPDGSTVFAYQESGPGTPASSFRVRWWRADNLGRGTVGLGASDATPDADLEPVVTCDRNGEAMLAYGEDADGAATIDGDRLVVAPLAGGAPILNKTTAGGSSRASTPDVRFAPDGRLWIVWTESVSGSSTTYVGTRAPGTSGAPVISELGTDIEVTELFFDPAGNTHIGVIDPTTLAWSVRTAAPGAASFGAGVQLPAASGAYGRLLTDAPDGKPRLLLTHTDGSGVRSYRLLGIPPAGSGSELSPVILTGDADATFSYLPSGDLFAAAVQHDSPTSARLVEGGLDTGAPPTLDSLDVPPLALPGVPITLRVTASDPLGLGDFHWTADGQEFSEQEAAVSFPSPGSYDVTARAVDRAGNATELTRTVRVVDPNAILATPAPAPTPAPRDQTAPTLLTATATRGTSGKAALKVVAKLSADETVAADVELIGTLKKGKAKGTLVLKSTRVPVLAPKTPKALALGIPKGLDKLVVKGKLLVRITLTDLSGNRTQKSIAVKLTK